MSTDPSDNPESLPYRGVLDESKRRIILALVANGSSRRAAARYVGCAASTISRTAHADPAFGEQLCAAEQTTEVAALRALHAAARNPRHWRAAAWLLERKNPEDFALRSPNALTPDLVIQFFLQLLEMFHEHIPEAAYDHAIRTMEQMVEILRHEAVADRWPWVQEPVELPPKLEGRPPAPPPRMTDEELQRLDEELEALEAELDAIEHPERGSVEHAPAERSALASTASVATPANTSTCDLQQKRTKID